MATKHNARHELAAVACMLLLLTSSVSCSGGDCTSQLASVVTAYPPGSAFYEDAVAIDNGRIDLKPAVIVAPMNAQEVAAVLQTMQSSPECEGLPFSVLNGGHSANGYCLNSGGVVLDVSPMNQTVLDIPGRRLTVGSGQVWINVYNLVLSTNSSLIPIGGGCPTVGVSGFTQGGGLSFLSRSYGLGADNVLSMSIVMPNGTFVVLDVPTLDEQPYDPAVHRPDSPRAVLWALRGGGGGNWGILTELTIQLYEARQDMLEAQLCWPIDQSAAIIPAYGAWASRLPQEMAAYGWYGTQTIPGLSGLMFCTTIVYNGPFLEGLPLLEPMVELGAVVAYVDNVPFLDWELYINGNFTAVESRDAYIRSGFFPADGLTEEVGTIFANAMLTAPSSESTILWDHVGGAISKKSSNTTAYVHRDAMFAFEVKAIWDVPSQQAANVEWAVQLGIDIQPFLVGNYINYIDPLLANWQEKYYGSNYESLVSIKNAVDPTNFFHFKQSVGSTYLSSPHQP